jgi:hypothetical protein
MKCRLLRGWVARAAYPFWYFKAIIGVVAEGVIHHIQKDNPK